MTLYELVNSWLLPLDKIEAFQHEGTTSTDIEKLKEIEVSEKLLDDYLYVWTTKRVGSLMYEEYFGRVNIRWVPRNP